jgi:DNA-binding NtrC family response regulator
MKRAAEERSVLVLGSDRNKVFVQTLRELKLVPTFVGSLEGVVHGLRHMQAAAILVDSDHRGADDLELVLNVRDLDPEVPILLVGSSREERAERILSTRKNTFLIRKATRSRSLADEIRPLLEPAGLSST